MRRALIPSSQDAGVLFLHKFLGNNRIKKGKMKTPTVSVLSRRIYYENAIMMQLYIFTKKLRPILQGLPIGSRKIVV